MNNRDIVAELMQPILHVASDAVLFIHFMRLVASLDESIITDKFIAGIDKLSRVCQHIIDEHD